MGRLAHDALQVTGDEDSALAGHRGRFNAQKITADFGPGQAGHQADLVLQFGATKIKFAHAQKLIEILFGHTHALLLFRRSFLPD